MSAQKGEFSLGVIEAVDVRPGFYGVASFAAERRAIGAPASHTVVELAFVRILVASGARAIFEMERKNFVWAASQADFVAISTGNRYVRAS